jgi:hypothetical protein
MAGYIEWATDSLLFKGLGLMGIIITVVSFAIQIYQLF